MRERARNQRRYWKDPIAAARRKEEPRRAARIAQSMSKLDNILKRLESE